MILNEVPELTTINYNAVNAVNMTYYSSIASSDSDSWTDYHIYLQNVIIGSDVEIIPKSIFSRFYSLKSIIIPENVRIVESSAFYLCDSVKNVSLPRSLDSIGSGAFYVGNDYPSPVLEEAYSYNPIPPKGSDIWGAAAKNAILYVPFGAKDAYSNNTAWNVFGEKQQFFLNQQGLSHMK
jgi:hypothetical protein